MINKYILIIGCGLSDHGTCDHNSIIYCRKLVRDYPNLTLSDYNNKKASTDNLIINRFIELNIESSDIDKLEKKYDYIEIRYVIHFSNFTKEKRMEIIDKLYKNNLNINGRIGIQCYSKIKNEKNIKDYNPMTYDEAMDIDNKYDKVKIIDNEENIILFINRNI